MGDTPRVSVLMAVYNAQPFLLASIDSILAQTVDDLELIIIDDCSTDDGWLVVAAAAARDRRVTALRLERQAGASTALNRGLERARGVFITRQDSDDISTPGRLAAQLSFLEHNPDIGAVGTAGALIDPEGRDVGRFPVPETDEQIQAELLDHMCFCGPVPLIRRVAFERAGLYFDETLSSSEDYDLCLRLAEVTRLANLPEPFYLYRQHGGSVSYRQKPTQIYRKARALEAALRRRGALPPSPRFRRAAQDYIRAAVLGHLGASMVPGRETVATALALDHGVLDQPSFAADVVRQVVGTMPADEATGYVVSLFKDVLPRGRRLRSLRRRIIAELHIREVFAATSGTPDSVVLHHLWRGVFANPAWLANSGVLSLAARRLASSWRQALGGPAMS